MKIDGSLIYKSCNKESKINYYSSFLIGDASRLIKWIYKDIGIALTEKEKKNNSITAFQPLS